MELTSLTMKVLFLFLPGIISCILIASLTETTYSSSFQFIVRAFVLGCLSYLMLIIIYTLLNWFLNPIPIYEVHFLTSILKDSSEIDFYEILYVSLCSILLSLIISKSINKAYLHKIARKLKIGNISGHRDVWNKLLSHDEVEWLLVKDRAKKLMYEGWLEQYYATHNEGELFLKDVFVYDDVTGEKYYELEGLYIVFNKDTMTIEFRQFNERSKKNGK